MKRTAYEQYLHHRGLAEQALGLGLIEAIEDGAKYQRNDHIYGERHSVGSLISLCHRVSDKRRSAAKRKLVDF